MCNESCNERYLLLHFSKSKKRCKVSKDDAYVALKYNDFLHFQKIWPDLIRISYMSWKYATFIIEATRQKGIKA